MDRDLWRAMLRFADEASDEELQTRKEEILQGLERHRPTDSSVRVEVRRLVRLFEEEQVGRLLRGRPRQTGRSQRG